MKMLERRQKCQELKRHYYAGVPSREELLDREVSPWLGPEAVLLDAGCGSDLPQLSQYGPKVGLALGVDVEAPKVERSEEHTSELQSHLNLVCRLLLEKKKK